MSIVHISGNVFHVCGRTIQRCGVCVAKLCDSLNVAIVLNPDGTEPVFPTFPPGRLIEVEAGNPTWHLLLPDVGVLPENSCLEFA